MEIGRLRPAVLAAIAIVLAGFAYDLRVADLPPLPPTPPAPVPSPTRRLLEARAPLLPPQVRQEVAAAVEEEAQRSGYDPLFVLAVMGVESRYRPSAVSRRGARGLMQLRTTTYQELKAKHKIDGPPAPAIDPVLDVRLAVRYLADLEKKFSDRDLALMAYNAGPTKLRRMLRRGRVPDAILRYPRAVWQEHRDILASVQPAAVPAAVAAAGPVPHSRGL